MGIGILLLGLTPPALFTLGLAALFLAGFTQPMVNGPIMAIIQAKVASDMQGRIFTLLFAAATAMTPLSLAVAGPVADRLGITTWYVVGGLACLLIAGAGLFLRPVMSIESHQDASGAAAAEAGAGGADD